MEKKVRSLLIVAGILLLINYLLSITHVFKMYSVPTTANEPGIQVDSKIFASNLIDFKNGDFVCYTHFDEMFGEQIRVHRLIGSPGDTIEIKYGVLFINDKNFDQQLVLKHSYLIDEAAYQMLLDQQLIDKEEMVYRIDEMLLIHLNDQVASKNGLTDNIKFEPKDQMDQLIAKIFNQNWNTDHFGPLQIPDGNYFVIGDNRHNSQDSRYFGLIDATAIKGTVLGE